MQLKTQNEANIFLFCSFLLKYSRHAHPRAHRASLFVSVRHVHTCARTVKVMIYSEGGGFCICPDVRIPPSLPSKKIKTADLYTHKALACVTSNRGILLFPKTFPFSSSIFSHPICQRLKKQRQRSWGEKLLPSHCWKASFHLKIFGIVCPQARRGWIWLLVLTWNEDINFMFDLKAWPYLR